MEYVIVEFVDRRPVLVDGVDQGFNKDDSGDYRLLVVSEGMHVFTLADPKDYVPHDHTVVIDGTSPIYPLRLTFDKKR